MSKEKRKPGKPPGSKPKEEKRGRGRPSKYLKLNIDMRQVEFLAAMGFTGDEMSEFMGINQDTFYDWIKRHKEFSETIKKGRIRADVKVTEALYKRATGYEHPEDKIFLFEGKPVIVPTIKHYPPDTAAAFIWLKNRRKWSDKQEVEVTENLADIAEIIKQRDNEAFKSGNETKGK